MIVVNSIPRPGLEQEILIVALFVIISIKCEVNKAAATVRADVPFYQHQRKRWTANMNHTIIINGNIAPL